MINLYENLRQMHIFKIFSHSIQEHGISFVLIYLLSLSKIFLVVRIYTSNISG